MGYDFSQLDDKEFEILSTDLLGKLLNKRIDRFTAGKDGGIDGRFFIDEDKEVIIQCKQYLGSGYSNLINKLKKSEVDKVKKLNPERYIFVTDLKLTPGRKLAIKEIFSPYINTTDDIFGKENLNDLLSDYPKIEEKHYRLWISSTTVFNIMLGRVINNAIIGRSSFEFKEIVEKSKMFVEIDSFKDALKRIESDRVIIISGESGIGKTTLSENLCLRLVSKYKYNFFEIKKGIIEAENIWEDGVKQLFYYDDFLGSNYFEVIENNNDSHIINFIKRVNKSKDKLFILNSRTTVINNGINYSTVFRSSNIEKNEFLLEIKDLTDFNKGEILYKHIYYSNLTSDFINEIFINKNYFKIINHNNFNPRLIEFITDKNKVNIDKADEYLNYIIKTLDNPKDIWKDPFDIQANEYVRALVSLVVYNGGSINEKDLIKSFNSISKTINYSSHIAKDFHSMIEVAVKSFLKRAITKKKEVIYELFNPSIADFVLHKYLNNEDILLKIFKSLESLDGLKRLYSIATFGLADGDTKLRLNETVYLGILNSLIDSNLKVKDNDYILYLLDMSYHRLGKNDILLDILKAFIIEDRNFSNNSFNYFLHLIENCFDDLNLINSDFLVNYIEKYEITDRGISSIGYILDDFYDRDDFKGFSSSLLVILEEKIEGYFVEDLKSIIDDLDIDKFIDFEDNDGNSELVYEISDIENYITLEGQKTLDSNLIFSYFEYFKEFDIDEIYSGMDIDVDELVNNYTENLYDNDRDDFGTDSLSTDFTKDIDDLFNRG